ncbi:diguanylate cyclase [Ectopseudomonas khazarica]|uniref:diguanylate cyclase n=1 Tax=Ectopseudomonas khazarica TaxID=2502979 RepID=UPI004033C62A
MSSSATSPPDARHCAAGVAALVCLLVLGACLLGILTRPIGHLAALWPANAVLLGALVRFPRLARPAGWCGALCAYLLADLLAGSSLQQTLLLSAGNLSGVVVGFLLLRRLHAGHRSLRTPASVPYLVLAIVAAAAASGCFGAITDPLLYGGKPMGGWVFWFMTELVNYMLFLPVMLTLPACRAVRTERRRRPLWTAEQARKLLPLLGLLVSAALCLLIGGPGVVAFPVPALLWCALSYRLFSTALLTFLASGWVLVSIALNGLSLAPLDVNSRPVLLSLRLGVSLIALAPLTVASVMSARNELLQRMRYLASHDQLSSLLNRWAFREQASEQLSLLAQQQRPLALLMLDIDHFKRINDNHGHAAGDQVLKAFANLAGSGLRKDELLARIGGEEFALLLPGCDLEQAREIAERIRQRFGDTQVQLDTQTISCTLSIGAVVAWPPFGDLDGLLLAADRMLYQAKALGRNRCEITFLGGASEPGAEPPGSPL